MKKNTYQRTSITKSIDINCDIGEGYGIYKVTDDEKLMPYISSANIACGFHAGDPQIMAKTLELAKKYQVAIGAHISIPDLQGFGRRLINFSAEEIYNIALYQIGALYALAKSIKLNLQHIKLHGALYHLASENKEVSHAIAKAIINFDRQLYWIGYPYSKQEEVAKEYNLNFAAEAFADRNYDDNGKLLPRTHTNALIQSSQEVKARIKDILINHAIKTVNNKVFPLDAQTICVHSDSPQALQILENIDRTLKQLRVNLKPLSWKART
jgi:UPF0271 protein